jgi:multidrug efflux pump
VIQRLQPPPRKTPRHHAVHAAGAGPDHRRRVSRTQYQFTLQDADSRRTEPMGAEAGGRLAKRAGTADVASDLQDKGLQVYVDIDRDAGRALGRHAGQRSTTRCTTPSASASISTIYTQSSQYRVVCKVKPPIPGVRRRWSRFTARPPAAARCRCRAVARVDQRRRRWPDESSWASSRRPPSRSTWRRGVAG